jgi:hypothetical protein
LRNLLDRVYNQGMTNDKTFRIAFNEKTTLYEVHLAGCKHLISRHLVGCATVTAASGSEAGAHFESRNEECLTKTGPCAR